MKIIKNLFKVLAVLLLLIVAALVAIPYFFKDDIVAAVKDLANENIEATIEFADVDISLIRHFPDILLEVNDLKVTGKGNFDGVNLVSAKQVNLDLDLMSVIKNEKPLKVHEIDLVGPDINIMVLKDGTANYDITQASDAATSPASTEDFLLQLSALSIKDGRFRYSDETLPMAMDMNGMNGSASGDFTLDVYDVDTEILVDEFTMKYGGVRYLSKAKTDLKAIINADMPNMKFTLKENTLKANDLVINADGFIAVPDENIAMDIKFNAPQNNFKNLLSIIPGAYTKGYEGVKATGDFTLSGFVKGIYNDKQLPAFEIKSNINNGAFQYPDLPVGVSKLLANISVKSPGNLDQMVVDIPKFMMDLGQEHIEGRFNLQTPMSDPTIDAAVKGKLDLAKLAKAFPMEGTNMSGIINADVTAMTKMSSIEREAYDDVNVNGALIMNNISYQSAGMPSVNLKTGTLNFTPSNLNFDVKDTKIGKSDLSANGSIDNFMAYFSPDKTMKGKVNMTSNYFDANEWMKEPTSASPVAATPETSPSSSDIFDRFDFLLDANIKKLDYDVYEIRDLSTKGHITSNNLRVDNAALKIGKSDLQANGTISNMMSYLFDNEKLGGNINLKSNVLDLNELMGEETTGTSTTTSTEVEPFIIPNNIDMDINADLNKVYYTNMLLEDVNGVVKVNQGEVMLDGVDAKTLNGRVGFEGGYSTKEPTDPKFNMKMNLKNMDFQKSFETFNSFEKLMPMSKYMSGVFNTTIVMKGKMGKDMYPDLNSLTADGFLETINGLVNGFEPLQAVGNSLNVDYFDDVSIGGTKNWFTIEDGKVALEPFDYTYKEVDMKIAGFHGIDQSIDYEIIAKIPRALLAKSGVGQAAETGLSMLQGQASKLGLNLDAGEFVNVKIGLTGSVTNPKTKVTLLGTDGESTLKDQATDKIKDELGKEKDRLQKETEAKLDAEKKKAQDRLNAEIEKAKKEAEKKAKEELDKVSDKVADEVKEQVNDKVGEELDKVGDKVKDQLGDKAGEGVDAIKDKLENFNPFGKKKKKKDGGN